jgi:type IV pilus assembly protein PilB
VDRPEKETPTGDSIASLLVGVGHLTEEQLRYAQRVHSKLSTKKTLLSVLEELKYVTEHQVRETLRANRISVPLGALLVELGYLSESDLNVALAIQKENRSGRLGEVLVENHLIDEERLLEILSYQLGFPYIEPALSEIDEGIVGLAPLKLYRSNAFVPIRKEGEAIVVAFSDPLNREQVRLAEHFLGSPIVSCIARKKSILDVIAKLQAKSQRSAIEHVNENVIVDAVNSLLAAAMEQNASDIHIEPLKNKLRIRFRLDGSLVPHAEFSLDMAQGISSRIKIMAGSDISEKRRHQDGRILFDSGDGLPIDLRASFYITIHGEKIVLRLLNKQSKLLQIRDIGMFPRMLQRFKEEVLDSPSGVVLVTGPTGSGKTTTLYSAVNYLNNINTSIITAEDPVEYVMDGVAQCSLNPKINLTFEETLRHIVRQDPDVIVIGEIRDKFSADTAIQAALTGHKILTTFHTEDSIGGLLRLLNMDIEAFLISSTVISVLAQRLVRKICPECSEDHHLSPHEIRRLGYNPTQAKRITFRRGRGCKHCRFLGYKGRVAVFELLILNELVKDALIERKTSYEIRRISIESSGLVTLLEDGIIKASDGLTSFEEIIRHLPRLDRPRPISELRRIQGAL